MKRYYLYLFILIGICCFSEVKAINTGKVFNGNDPAVRYIGRTLVSPAQWLSTGWGHTLKPVLRVATYQ